MKLLSLAAGAILLAICSLTPAYADAPNASFSDVKYYNTTQGVGMARGTFAWPEDRDISAQCTIGLEGFEGKRQVQLFVDMRDPATGEIIASNTHTYTLEAGIHNLTLGPLFLATVQGKVELHGEFEISIDGISSARHMKTLYMEGSPKPFAEITNAQFYPTSMGPAGAKDSFNWQSDGEVTGHVDIAVGGTAKDQKVELHIESVDSRNSSVISTKTLTYYLNRGMHSLALEPVDLSKRQGSYDLIMKFTAFVDGVGAGDYSRTLHVTAPAQPFVQVKRFYSYDPALGNVEQTTFDWKKSNDLALKLMFDALGFNETRGLGITLTIRSEDGDPIYRKKHKYSVDPGSYEYQFADMLDLNTVFGNHTLYAEAILELDGAAVERSMCPFAFTGGPPASISIVDAYLWNVKGKRGENFFVAGDEFFLEAGIFVRDNRTGSYPVVHVVAIPEDADYIFDLSFVEPSTDPAREWMRLGAPMGEWRIKLKGKLPQQCWQGPSRSNRFKVYLHVTCGLGSGEHVVLEGTIPNGPFVPAGTPYSNSNKIGVTRNWEWVVKQTGQ
jgi:hypothetical protein